MNLKQKERIRTLIEFVEQQRTASARLIEDGAAKFEIALYRSLGLPDNVIKNFVQQRFPNNISRMDFIKTRYGIDLDPAPKKDIVQLMTAIIYRHGDFAELKSLIPSPAEKKQIAWASHPVWRILRERAIDTSGRVSPKWRDVLHSYIMNDIKQDSERREFLRGVLPPSKLKTRNLEKVLPAFFDRLKKSNSIGL
jgi:hypothetical protein